MITQALHTAPIAKGPILSGMVGRSVGKQRYRCREYRERRGRTFLLDYSYPGHSQHVKDQIVDMAMNTSGIHDTAWVLHVSPSMVIKELKKEPELLPVN